MSISTILIDISNSIQVNTKDLSLIFTFFTTGAILGQLTSVFYNTKFTKLRIILVSYALLVPITIALSFSNSIYTFFILYIFAGYILGVIWIQATVNVLESKIKNKDRLMTIALCFYPFGAFTAPFIASTIVGNNLSWRYLYYIIIFLIVIITILYLTVTRNRKDEILTKKREKINFRKIFHDRRKNMVFIIVAFGLIFYSIADTSLIVWSPTFFRVERMFSMQAAGYVISIFWMAVIIGRIIVSPVLGKIQANRVLFMLSTIAIIFTSFTIFSRTKFNIFTGIGLAGIGYSAIFPLFISSGSTLYKKGRGVLVTILFVAAYIGKSIAPFMTRFTSKYNMTLSVSLSVIFMGITMILIIFHIFYKKRFVDNKT
ncbi:MAG: MFS transporter [Actinobacteria bacterium]|nr:MFS transporter [Actinomycetota bacterium]